MMSLGGNNRLAEFLNKCGISRSIPIKQLYNSKIMHFYRRMLKAFCNDEPFEEELPDRSEMIDSYTAKDNVPSLTNRTINIDENHYVKNQNYSSVSNDSNRYQSIKSKFSSEDYKHPSLDNKMIAINDDHYSNRVSYSNYSNEGKKFESIGSNYNNDPRFASISSEPIYNYSLDNDGYTSTGSKIYSFLGSAFEVTKSVAGALKEKVGDMDITSKMIYTGGKTVEVIKYTGSKVIEKGSEVAVNI
jgi:hypothetical protein